MKKRTSVVILVVVISSNSLLAQAPKDYLSSVFGAGKVSTNSTGASTWKDPSSGATYYSGGSYSVSFNTGGDYTPWADAREPSIGGGCGEFDFDAGFASIIDMDGITDQLSSAGTSMVGGFLSSILYSTPILGDVIKEVKKIAQEISNMLQNACSLGQQMGASAGADKWGVAALEKKGIEWVTEKSKEIGWIGEAKDAISDADGAINAGLTCLGKSSGAIDCINNLSKSNKPVTQAITSTQIKKLQEVGAAKAKIPADLSKIVDKNSNKKIYGDMMSISTYLGYNKDGSKYGYVKRSGILTDGVSRDILSMIFLASAEKHIEGSPELCEEMHKQITTVLNPPATAAKKTETKDDQKLAAKNNLTDKGTPIIPAKGNSLLEIKVGTGGFSPKTELMQYIMTGYVYRQRVKAKNDDIYIVQYPVGKVDNPSKFKKTMVLCPSSSNDFITLDKWDGLATVSEVQTAITKIANDETISANIPVIAEAAQLAKVLGHKIALQHNNVGVLAPAIDAHSIALLNNYILVSNILNGLAEAQNTFDSNAGTDGGKAPIERVGTPMWDTKDLQKYKKDLEDKIALVAGVSDIVQAFIRDSQTVEKAWKEYSEKKRRSYGN